MNNLDVRGVPDCFTIISGNTEIADCYYEKENAVPFIIANGKLYLGENGDGHWSVGNEIIGISYSEMYDSEKYDEHEIYDLETKRDKAVTELCRSDKNYIAGRIWINELNEKYSIISFWGSEVKNKSEINTNVINELLNKFGISKDFTIIVVFDETDKGKIVKYTKWNLYIPKMGKNQKNAYELHLMNSKDKHAATEDFRKNRDKKIGRKLTNDKGVEMPVAQYRSMIYSENINRIIRNVLKEYIDKNAKGIIF